MKESFKSLVGEIIIEVLKCNDYVMFFSLHHEYWLYVPELTVVTMDVCGDLDDLLNSSILMAEEKYINNNEFTASFYTIATKKGYVDIKFQASSGSSWYSERAEFRKTDYSRKQRDEDLYMIGQ